MSLVKTSNQGDQFAGRRADDDRIKTCMRGELDDLPRKAILEGFFYLAWVAALLFAMPRLLRVLAGANGSPGRRTASVAVVVASSVFLFLLPTIITGYGGSSFTTWAGPFASSSSGPYAHLFWSPAETISYRPMQELLTLPMMKLVAGFGGHWVLIVVAGAAYAWAIARVALLLQRA